MFQGKGQWTRRGEPSWPGDGQILVASSISRMGGAGPVLEACRVRSWPKHRLWKEENDHTQGAARIQIHVASAKRLSRPVPRQGPAGFHGNTHTVVRAGEALGSHLVQPLWGLWERASCSYQHLAGLMRSQQPRVPSQTKLSRSYSSPKALLALCSPQGSVQILGLYPRPHTLSAASLPATQAIFYHLSGPLSLLCPLPRMPSPATSVKVLLQCSPLPGGLP